MAAVIAVVYGGPALRGGASRPSVTPPPVSGPLLNVAASEITRLFEQPRFGSFTFDAVNRPGQEGHTVGESEDGGTIVDLFGPPDNLRQIVLSLRVFRDGQLDVEQRSHMAMFLALYAPDALGPLQRTLEDAISSGKDLALEERSDRLAARLETHLQAGGMVSVTLSVAPGAG